MPHKMFDNGDGHATIAGGQGTMWTTALQIGELVDTAQRVFDQTETRLLVTHTSPGREGLMAQLALVLKADLTVSAGLHFRYATSYNEFSIQSDFEGFRQKLISGKDGFDKVWDSVKDQVDTVIDENQKVLLDKALSVIGRVPPSNRGANGTLTPGEEPAWKNCWNWNLCDAAYGSLVLDIREGRISSELKSQGFNFAYRKTATANGGDAAGLLLNSDPPANVSTTQPTDAPQGKSSPALGVSPESKANVDAATTPDGPKGKKKDKKDKKTYESAAEPEESKGLSVPDAPSAPEPAPGSADGDEARSPVADTSSTGTRTPTRGKPQRNPWTLFMRMTVSANEAELREYFGDAAAGITRINYPSSFAGRHLKIAYVEFGDEETMKAGLEKRAEKFKDTVPEVMQATDRETREGHGRGRGRGRGGFVARGFAAAGLTQRPKPNHTDSSGNTAPTA